MGYCCAPFRIDFDRLNAVRGSRNAAFLERLNAHIVMITAAAVAPPLPARLMLWAFGAGDSADPYVTRMRMMRAARHIVADVRLKPSWAAEYAAVLDAICWVLGTIMDNSEVAPAPLEHFEDVDQVLRERGLYDQVSMWQLIFSGPPIDLPALEDFPAIGHMTPASVAAAHRALAREDWSTAPDDLQPTLQLLSTWIKDASAHHEGIVCFYA
jgi:hypothetical protein